MNDQDRELVELVAEKQGLAIEGRILQLMHEQERRMTTTLGEAFDKALARFEVAKCRPESEKLGAVSDKLEEVERSLGRMKGDLKVARSWLTAAAGVLTLVGLPLAVEKLKRLLGVP